MMDYFDIIEERLNRIGEDMGCLRNTKKRNIQVESLELKKLELNHKMELEREKLEIYKTLNLPLHEFGTVGQVISLLKELTPEQLDVVISELERGGE